MVIVDIGESVNRLSDEFKAEHDSIPWIDIVDMRNIFAHNYVGVNFRQLWYTLEEDIPELKENIKELIMNIDEK